MRRVLLLVAALTTLSLVMGTASASGTAFCEAPLSVHNAASCTATNQLTAGGAPTLSVNVAIGPVADRFSGDVRVTLTGAVSNAIVQRVCVYRATNGFGGLAETCLDYSEGTFIEGELATCSGAATGVGSWKVTCAN